MSRVSRWALVAAAVALWFWLPALLPGRETVLVQLALYVPIVVGIALLAGYTGQLSVGQAAFFGMGAYGTGILTVHVGLNPWLAMPLAVAGTGLAAIAIGGPVFLLRGYYLVLATLGFNVVFEVVARQLDGVTGGASGMVGIPPLSIGGTPLLGNEFFYYAASAVAALSMLLSARLIRSRVGRGLQAIEGSETAASTLGIGRRKYTTQVFAWSAVLAAASGALYAEWLRFLSPSTFGVGVSIDLLIMAVIGGIASVPGALVGTVLFVTLRELLPELVPAWSSEAGAAAQYELALFGVLLAAIVIFMPEGIWPRLIRRRGGRPSTADAGEDGPAPPALDLPSFRDKSRGPLLRAEHVSRRFGGLTALDDVSLEVRRGEILGIIGPNGAGKTTLLNLLSGVMRPTSGRITLGGRELGRLRSHGVARLGVTRSFQTPRIFGQLSVLDNVKTGLHRHLRAGFVRSLIGLTGGEERRAHEQAMGALALVGAHHLAGHDPAELSFGSLRMVELARALAGAPELLLLDEPASGLSAEERDELQTLIRRLRDAGTTIVLVEHDVPLVMDLADRVLVLHHGARLAEGPPEAISADPAVISAYLGAPGEERRNGRGGQRDLGCEPLLSLQGMSAGYGAVTVLHDVSLDVRAGEIVGLLGPNGAGKTTLMRAALGIRPSSGERRFAGVQLSGHGPEAIVRLGMSLVPEGRELLPGMTVRDHLVLGAYSRRERSGSAAFRRRLEWVEQLFPILAERRDVPAESLSGGQQQMVAIGRALMSQPRLLLLDEPLLGLAPLVVGDILATVETLAREGLGIVIVEQNAATVLPVVDRAYVLETGRITTHLDADVLAARPDLTAAFLGSAVERPISATATATALAETNRPAQRRESKP